MSKTSDRKVVRKFGYNAEVATATDPEDIWSVGGLYVFPTAAATTTIVSDSDEDDIDGGTGAQTVAVQMLDTDYVFSEPLIEMQGQTPVTLPTDALRVFRVRAITPGTNGTNVGTIQVKHDATVLAEIPAGKGQTQMAIYTVPADWSYAYLRRWRASIGRATGTSFANVELWARHVGESWRSIDTLYLQTQGSSTMAENYRVMEYIPPKTDLLVRASEVSATLLVAASFDLIGFGSDFSMIDSSVVTW